MSETAVTNAQVTDLRDFDFDTRAVMISLSPPKYLAKCNRCRALVEVPTNVGEGGGEDVRVHYEDHERTDAIIASKEPM